MSNFDIETTTDVQRRPAIRPEGSGPDASTVIGLQRLAGNSAVAAAIRSGQINSEGPVDIQRLTDDDDEDYEDEDEQMSDDAYAEMSDDVDQDLDDDLNSDDTEEDEDEDEDEFAAS